MQQSITDISQLSGGDIGIQTGSAFDAMTDKYIDGAQKKYYNSFVDMAVATAQGKSRRFLLTNRLHAYSAANKQVVFMPAAGIMFLCIGICMAETFQVEIIITRLVTLFIIALVLGIAAPPVPGRGLTCCMIPITQLGIPEEAIPIAITIQMGLDFPAAAVNIFCLQSELTEPAGGSDMLDMEILRKNS